MGETFNFCSQCCVNEQPGFPLCLEKIVGKKPAVVAKYKLAYIPLKTIMNFDDVMKNVIFPLPNFMTSE